MSSKLFYFLVKMGEDIELQRRYHESEASRQEVMEDFALSKDEQDALNSDNEETIQRAVMGNSKEFDIQKNWKICKNWKP